MAVWYAGLVTLVGGSFILIISLFVLYAHEPSEAAEGVVSRIYKIRKAYFFTLIAVITVSLILTLRYVPYHQRKASRPQLFVSVVGRLWSWQIGPLRPGAEGAPVPASEGRLVLPAGKLIEFQVTSADVNHGFGIYDGRGRLLAQTQAMPGYTNKLRVVFHEPGTYYILCMEYCSLLHHAMAARVEVR